MSLPKEEQVRIVITSKKRIADLTGKILDVMYDSDSENYQLINKQESAIKKSLYEIVSELSIISGFCSSNEREFVNSITRYIPEMTPSLQSTKLLLEDWCTIVNGIAVDFNKTPFKFLNTELKGKWRSLEAKINVLE
ncbi:hypothetical protein MUP77_03815 [Candidatus Bathyarchaeota archaeon]|nr:hypothetical protein [Candidatus Bathyarchaeota archaeon]